MGTSTLIWGAVGIVAVLAIIAAGVYIYRYNWKKAEKLGAAVEKADTTAVSSELARKTEQDMAHEQAQRKSPSEYRDWVASKGTKAKGEKK